MKMFIAPHKAAAGHNVGTPATLLKGLPLPDIPAHMELFIACGVSHQHSKTAEKSCQGNVSTHQLPLHK